MAASQRASQAVSTTFLRAARRCGSSTCIINAAATALAAEGAIATKFNPDNFPAGAQGAANAYANVLVSLQRAYLSIGSLTNRDAALALLPGLEQNVRELAAGARTVESLL